MAVRRAMPAARGWCRPSRAWQRGVWHWEAAGWVRAVPVPVPRRSSGRPGGEKPYAASCRRLGPRGFSHFQTYVPRKKGFLEDTAKERHLSSPPALSSIASTVNVASASAHHQPGGSPSITGYLNFLQRLLKATGGLGKRPGSACTLAAWRHCCRYSTNWRRTSSHAPQPLRAARPRVKGPHLGERGRGAACLPCTHLQWLCGSAAPSVTTIGVRLALKVGERNQLQKTSPLFPTGSSKSGWQTKANVVASESC
ncbi:uncharacterized protein LOC142414806 isoform X1 [Mycteria americana]|uniref:uncharacterized protein LOC142414806 isoform X1 n=1 Tax=Mycteria americana TaxID=33587 RepID=UPI003F58E2AC